MALHNRPRREPLLLLISPASLPDLHIKRCIEHRHSSFPQPRLVTEIPESHNRLAVHCIERRSAGQQIGARYNEQLADCEIPGFQLPNVVEGRTSVYAQYTVLCEDRVSLQEKLKEAGVPSVAYYAKPLHLQPVFKNLGYRVGDFPVTESIANRCLSLPMSAYLSEDDQQAVITALKE